MQKSFPLGPVARCRTLSEYLEFLGSDLAARCEAEDAELLQTHGHEETWAVPGYSLVANQFVEYTVDQLSGGYLSDDIWHPNLRERLVCPVTHLNNRQRLICALVQKHAFRGAKLWLMEHVTPVYAWVSANLTHCEVTGSEYLDPNSASGTIIDGIMHQDAENLSFADGSLDLIVSNEVLEHVARPFKAFSECARVLTRGGRMVATIPFMTGVEDSIVRAALNYEGDVVHILEPVYHGNPVSLDGSLVFTDFGWDVLRKITECGFRDAWFDIYHAPELGHFGNGLIVLEAVK
jgi:hypothetical protein